MIENIKTDKDIKQLNIKQLESLSNDLRAQILSVTKQNGGHLASNLGIVETTVAIHKVFDLPKDKLIFDVGHQCYAHKILSGRREGFSTIRCDGGLSGFPDINESEYDAFGVGHAGTSVSAGLGMCYARDKKGENYTVVVVVGDGAFANGLNLEALFSSNNKPKNLVVILNDNGMSISKNQNGFYRFISKKTSKRSYVRSKKALKKFFRESFITRTLGAIKNFIKRVFGGVNIFEEFGFKYLGVFDGNDIRQTTDILETAKNYSKEKAVLVHLKTTKGKGLSEAERRADLYHGVGKDYNIASGEFSLTAGEEINKLIEKDQNVVAITAGMKNGTGLLQVEKAHPQNFFDVGIAEEYAITLACGMAVGGLTPFVAIYSTFMQRAFDEILHDVCIQNLPVVMLLDRAGFNGRDGKTHQGLFDLSFLSCIPNLTVLSPSSKFDLQNAIEYAYSLKSPVAIRYPKDGFLEENESVEYTSSLWTEQVKEKDYKTTVLAVGPKANRLATEVAKNKLYKIRVINARSVKPLDYKVLDGIKEGTDLVTIEENVLNGGFGSMVKMALKDKNIKISCLGVGDKFVKHGSINKQFSENGLTIEKIIEEINFLAGERTNEDK